jgi:hypothetical protein
MRRILGQEAAARNAAPVGLGEETGDGAADRHRYRRRLVLQPQFQLMLPETATVMTALGAGLMPATPARPGQHMGD